MCGCMKRLISIFLLCVVTMSAFSQVVITSPAMVTENQVVSITFNAALGSGGLMNYTGDVYAHTGVITNKSTSDNDWKYVVADWSVNLPKAKLTRSGTNTYQLMISPDIRDYYGVPEGETILKMAFVFRSADGSKEAKDTGGKDILVSVYASGVNVSFSKPSLDYSVLAPGTLLDVEVHAAGHQQISLFMGDELLHTSEQSPLTHTLTVPQVGKHLLRAVATDGSTVVADTCSFVVLEPTVQALRPSGLRRGVNRVDDYSVTLMIYAPHKNYIYLAGDFNDWMPGSEHQMIKDGDYFWLTLSHLSPDTEYAYQYWIDGLLKIADPYTNKVLDPFNDKYIPSRVYPDLKAYPLGKTEGLVSVFQTNPTSFEWTVSDFVPPSPDTLVVYELLIRDFTANGDIKTVTDTLAYLKRLGVNAIELMPFNEFEGNDSWGYNPSLYFAPDKAYGTAHDYKQFIDACHRQGIAVIQDMVLNHSFGQSPFVKMYFDGEKPAANNPWYNRDYNMQNPDAQWGFDFNHESLETQALVDSICSFWMTEYNIDGFRFDFTKGFTNTPYGEDDWASAYDASRIAILKRMANEIWKRKTDALVIFEHLSDNAEETELADHGILLWGNQNHAFNEATMGFHENNKSDITWANYQYRGFSKPHVINYMESHDEERLMVRNLLYGNSTASYQVKQLSVSLERMKTAGAILFAIPGPVMVWQFGELGYDVSIDENGRTGKKPVLWTYQQEPERTAVFETWSDMIALKKKEPLFRSSDFSLDLKGAVKTVRFMEGGDEVVVLANFDVKSQTVQLPVSVKGTWYNYFKGDSLVVNQTSLPVTLKAGEYRVLSSRPLAGFNRFVEPAVVEPDRSSFVYPEELTRNYTVNNPFETNGEVWVYNSYGRLIHQMDIERSVNLNLNAASGGVCVVTVHAGGNVARQKIVLY